MKKQLIAWLLALCPIVAFAAAPSQPLDSANLDIEDTASQQRGLQLYMNYCMGCHSLQYSRYQRVTEDLGIPEDLMLENIIFDPNVKIGELMTNAMSSDDGTVWFGAAPPDLTLAARARGVDWLYTYLRSFYRDPSRPWGVNNLVFPDVGMPHALLELQGVQECAPGPSKAANGGVRRDPLTGDELLYDSDGEAFNACGRFRIAEPGSMDVEEFDQAVYDLVNFMSYVADPSRLDRQRIGIYALLFLALLFVFAWLLNREYWKDVH